MSHTVCALMEAIRFPPLTSASDEEEEGESIDERQMTTVYDRRRTHFSEEAPLLQLGDNSLSNDDIHFA